LEDAGELIMARSGNEDREVIPVVEEEAILHKRNRVTGIVRARTRIHETEQPVAVNLAEEEIEIERIPRDEFVEAPIPDRREGDTLVISVIEEVPVVETRLKLVEEVRITRRRTTRRVEETVTLRRQEVVVERDDPPADGDR
jgi:stress response protein YsnF